MTNEDWTIKGNPPVRGKLVNHDSTGLSVNQRTKLTQYCQEMNTLTKIQYIADLLRWEEGEDSRKYLSECEKLAVYQEYVEEARAAAVALVPSAEARIRFA